MIHKLPKDTPKPSYYSKEEIAKRRKEREAKERDKAKAK